MTTQDKSPGAALAGGCGLLLLISLFLPWYGGTVSVAAPGGFGGPISQSDSASAWEAMSGIDVVLLLIALVAIGAAAAVVVQGTNTGMSRPMALAVAAAGALAVLLVIYRLVEIPGAGDLGTLPGGVEVELGRKLGAFVALIAAAGVAAAGLALAGGASEARRESEAPATA